MVVSFACGLFLLFSTLPTAAVSSSCTSSPSKGVPHLENIQENTEEFMSGNNRMPGMKERSSGGLNSVQGSAELRQNAQP